MGEAIESELDRLIREMRPFLHEHPVVFCTLRPVDLEYLPFEPLGVFREEEGVTVIAPEDAADLAGLEFSGRWAHITLRVHSPLHAVGFMAVIASGLARAGISVNPVSGFHHDHLFVPWEQRGEAMEVLAGINRDIFEEIIPSQKSLSTQDTKPHTAEYSFQMVGKRIHTICSALMQSQVIEARILNRCNVTNESGLYLWRWIDSARPAYTGIAIGRNGLRQRIIEQHLRPAYKKSVFRIAVGKDQGLDVGEECVEFIRKHFTISFRSFPDESHACLEAAESIVIASLRPQYNKMHKNSDLKVW